jgi:glycosyltransferase involved in cell wall biosynthesis
MRIAVLGEPKWSEVAFQLLEKAHLEPVRPELRGRGAMLRWALGSEARQFDAVHHVMGPVYWRHCLALMLTRRPVVWHWIGSDVLGYRHSLGTPAGRVNRWAARMRRSVHLADSPELADELRPLGIDSEVVRLLPGAVEAEIEPLPGQFAVLSYWSDGRRAFYGGDLVLQLAERFPDVPFRVAGADGVGVSASDNVEFLGYRDDLSEVYRRSTVLIRMPEHDSLSAMVLEMLARGRHVIYNKEFPGCMRATNVDEAMDALEKLRRHCTLNETAATTIKRDFSRMREAEKLARIYREMH